MCLWGCGLFACIEGLNNPKPKAPKQEFRVLLPPGQPHGLAVTTEDAASVTGQWGALEVRIGCGDNDDT